MRGLVEIRLFWLLSITLLVNSNYWLGIEFVLAQFLILLIIAWPPQKVALFGYISMISLGIILSLIDIVFGGFNLMSFSAWILVGLCYILLYEYTALYELSSFLSDYKIPRTINAVLNFGFRFIPVTFDAAYEAYIGLKARNKLPRSKILMAKKIMPSLLVMILHKFEQMWISYNIRQFNEKRFNISINMNDCVFIIFFISNLLLVLKLI